VWTTTQVDEITLTIQSNGFLTRDAVDDFGFIFFAHIPEEFHCFLTVPFFTYDFFIALDDFMHAGFDLFQIIRGESFLSGKVIIETIINGRANGDLSFRIQFLDGFGHNMGRIMAQDFQGCFVTTGDDGHIRISRDFASQIPLFTIHQNGQSSLGKTWSNIAGQRHTRHRAIERANGTIGQG